jgi:hypothetical protein
MTAKQSRKRLLKIKRARRKMKRALAALGLSMPACDAAFEMGEQS